MYERFDGSKNHKLLLDCPLLLNEVKLFGWKVHIILVERQDIDMFALMNEDVVASETLD